MGTIMRVETHDPVLALTFDDGPHPEYTIRLLDILDRYGAKATFFCVGKFAAKHRDVIRQAAGAGHALGNHTWEHACLPLLGYMERCAQIRKCAEALRPYGSRLFRPPYGFQNFASRLVPLQYGYRVISWTLDTGDWQPRNAGQILEEVLPRIGPGKSILFHDRIARASLSPAQFNRRPTLEAVSQLLEQLHESYRFVTIPELLKSGHVVRMNWYRKADKSSFEHMFEESCPGEL